jgi:AcrR family transcriptional regulator
VPRAGLTPSAVTDAAIAQLDDGGPESLTLAAVASRTGVATPSLYKHVGSLAELRSRVVVRVVDELTAAISAAVLGRSGDDALRAAMHAYRDYATAHPRRYLALPPAPAPEQAEAAERLLGVFFAVMRGYRLDGSDAIHAVRAVRAALHGFVVLESSGGFRLPEDLDESFERLVAMVTAGLPR